MGKLILEFFGLIGCATGFVGGILISLLCGDYWYIAAGIVALGVAAFPVIRKWWGDLNGARKADE